MPASGPGAAHGEPGGEGSTVGEAIEVAPGFLLL